MERAQTNTTVPPLGTLFDGGLFGGIINVNGQHQGIIWAPKAFGYFSEKLLKKIKDVDGARDPADSAANTQALLAAGSPAAERVVALDINGHKDWLIPARDVLELGYRNFKPTEQENWASWRDGENANSVPPGWLYTPDFPLQTEIVNFRAGSDEAFDPVWHWSSTLLPHGQTAFLQGFGYGQVDDALFISFRVRAVRLIQL